MCGGNGTKMQMIFLASWYNSLRAVASVTNENGSILACDRMQRVHRHSADASEMGYR